MSDPVDDLHRELAAALMADVGVSEKMAQPFVASVMRCLRGRRVYVPQARRVYPKAQIRDALEAGMSVRSVTREFNISRSKLHAMFPGGLPCGSA